jgi:hypothetical protein
MSKRQQYVDPIEMAQRIRGAVWGLAVTLFLFSCTLMTWVDETDDDRLLWGINMADGVPIGPRFLPVCMVVCLALGVAASAEGSHKVATAAWVMGVVTFILVNWLVWWSDDELTVGHGADAALVANVVFVGVFAWMAWGAPDGGKRSGKRRDAWMDPGFGTVDKQDRRLR